MKRPQDNYIKMEDLKDGYTYRISARNASVGIWRASTKGFLISRHKFGDNFVFEEFHYDTGAPFGTVKPWEELEKSPFTPDEIQYETRYREEDGKWFKKGDSYAFLVHGEEVRQYLNPIADKENERREKEYAKWAEEMRKKREAEAKQKD